MYELKNDERCETMNESEQVTRSKRKKENTFAGFKTCDTNRKQLHLVPYSVPLHCQHLFKLVYGNGQNITYSSCYLFQATGNWKIFK